MCEVAIHTKPITVHGRVNRYDPTRTTTLRNAFVRKLNGKFDHLVSLVRKAVVQQDVFGLNVSMQANVSMQVNEVPGKNAFDFARSSEKIAAFNDWFHKQAEEGILETYQWAEQVGQGAHPSWTDTYITDSYKRGVQRSRYEMKKVGADITTIEESGGINVVMGTPMHIDRVGLIGSRVYEELKGITTQMSTQVNRVLAQGLIDGDNPKLLADKLVASINGKGVGDLGITDTLGRFIPAKRRAQTLARTEVIRAHHMGMMQEYENWGVLEVEVEAEFVTAEDDRVCPECEALEGQVFALEDAKSIIPVHPNCRCIMLPTDLTSTPEAVAAPEEAIVSQEIEPISSEERDVTVDRELQEYIEDEYGITLDVTKMSGKDINDGYCADWADKFIETHGGVGVTVLDVVPPDAGFGVHGHTFVFKNGKFFDAEHASGVTNIMDLNFFKRVANHQGKFMDEHLLRQKAFAAHGGSLDLPTPKLNVAQRFLDPQDRRLYVEYQKEWNEYFDTNFDPADFKMTKGRMGSDVSEMLLETVKNSNIGEAPIMALQEWQGDTWEPYAGKLKLLASQLESGAGEMIYRRSMDASIYLQQLAEVPISKQQYISMRAFNQAYMKKKGVSDQVTLYRGIGGGKGNEIRRNLRSDGMTRTIWNIEEAPVTGYTSNPRIARRFGYSEGGVDITRVIDRDDIFWHNDILSTLTMVEGYGSDKIAQELEYLVISRKLKINVADTKY